MERIDFFPASPVSKRRRTAIPSADAEAPPADARDRIDAPVVPNAFVHGHIPAAAEDRLRVIFADPARRDSARAANRPPLYPRSQRRSARATPPPTQEPSEIFLAAYAAASPRQQNELAEALARDPASIELIPGLQAEIERIEARRVRTHAEPQANFDEIRARRPRIDADLDRTQPSHAAPVLSTDIGRIVDSLQMPRAKVAFLGLIMAEIHAPLTRDRMLALRDCALTAAAPPDASLRQDAI